MLTRYLLLALGLWLPARSHHAADAVFSADGKRVWVNLREGEVVAVDLPDRGNSAGDGGGGSPINVSQGGSGPKIIQALAMSKAGNLLLAAPDAVWAFNPATLKTVRVAAMPTGFNIGDLAYQETTGAILAVGSFLRADQTVERAGAFRIAKGSDKAEPVFVSGMESVDFAAFDAVSGKLFLGAGPDLWGGELTATEHGQTEDFAWQFRGFRLAALGTPASGEGTDASQTLAALAAGGGRLVVTMRTREGGTILGLPAATLLPRHGDGSVDRALSLKDRWAFQQKLLATAQFLTPPGALPRLPTVAVSPDGARVVYQTAAAGVRRWWLLERTGKARMIKEESD